MSLRVTVSSKVKALSAAAVAKASLNRAPELVAVDAKPCDLSMGRLKLC
jgi:hypothetical protein